MIRRVKEEIIDLLKGQNGLSRLDLCVCDSLGGHYILFRTLSVFWVKIHT